ncbi:MAG: TPM domain-containing protein [Flavobacteriales bacterium]|nr:TPM domain-containing protein [Flavobacteriales bacterium]
MDIRDFLTQQEKDGILRAIRDAENRTSGEIRLHLENHCKADVLNRAAVVFHKLDMDASALRNGVLFYVAVKDHKFAILGDKGINDIVPPDFWDNIKEHMLAHFKENRYAQGITEGIGMAGEQLRKHFPVQEDDVNELPDDISYGGTT